MNYSVFVCFVFSCLHVTVQSKKDFSISDKNDPDKYNKNVAGYKIYDYPPRWGNDDLLHTAERDKKQLKKQNNQNEEYEKEKLAGDITDLLGANVHFRQSENYNNFGRRFVLQYPYGNGSENEKNQDYLTPVKAPPELVLAVAKQSAIQQALNPVDPDPGLLKKSLRSGDYWNGVWKEEVYNPNKMLRSGNYGNKSSAGIEVVQARVMPGSKLFRLISALKKFSPRLLYVINNGKKK